MDIFVACAVFLVIFAGLNILLILRGWWDRDD